MDDFNLAMSGDPTAMAQMGASAFGQGRLVEAVYWMVMADLRGFHNLAPVLNDYAEVWRRMECPEQAQMTHEFFTEEQRQFGWHALLWIANVDRVLARNWFQRAAQAGNYDARDFLAHSCV